MAWSSLKHRYSYSGSDAKAFAYFKANSTKGVLLEAMHTISFSLFEAKGRVRSLGFKSVRGFTRAVREISGTMIMMVIEDHPLAGLMARNPSNRNEVYGISNRSWSLDGKSTAIGARSNAGPHADYFEEQDQMRRAPTTLPPFNIMIEYNTEVPDAVMTNGPITENDGKKYQQHGVRDSVAVVELIDVEIMGQGIVTSVNDMVTEVQYQFVARDYREFMKEDKAIEEMWNVSLEEMVKRADNQHIEEVRKKNSQVKVKSNGEVEITTPINDSLEGSTEASKHMLEASLKSESKKPIDSSLNEIDQVGGGGTSDANLVLTTAAELKTPKGSDTARIKTYNIPPTYHWASDNYKLNASDIAALPGHPLGNGIGDNSKVVSMELLPANEDPGTLWSNEGHVPQNTDRFQIITEYDGSTNYVIVDVSDAQTYSELRNKLQIDNYLSTTAGESQ